MIAPTPPPTEPPIIADRFAGEEDEFDALEAFEGRSPVEEAEDEAEVWEETEDGESVEERIELGVLEVVELVVVLEVVVVDKVVEEVLDGLEVVLEEREELVAEDGVGRTGQLFRTVETGTEVTIRLVWVTVRASVVVLRKDAWREGSADPDFNEAKGDFRWNSHSGTEDCRPDRFEQSITGTESGRDGRLCTKNARGSQGGTRKRGERFGVLTA
jgi:hypothetical protein